MNSRQDWTNVENTFSLYAEELLSQAKEARENAYAPYSGFKVGAALLLADGTISRGCNVENVSYGATVCAERVAVWSAVASGRLSVESPPVALAVTAMPCAMCLQVISEFADGDFPIYVAEDDGLGRYRLADLLPKVFKLL